MHILGTRLKKLRQQRGLSLRELAKLAHMSHSFIADIEAGRSTPSLDTLQALAKALNIPVSILIGEGKNQSHDDTRTLEEFPEIARVLRRAGKKLTPADRRRIARIIQAAIEDTEDEE